MIGKIIENRNDPVTLNPDKVSVQQPIQKTDISIGKQQQPQISIQKNNNSQTTDLVVNNMYYSQLNDYGKAIYNKLRSESMYFLDGEHVFDYGTIFDRTFTIRSGKRNFRKVVSSGS